MKNWPIITLIFLILFNVSCRQEEYVFAGIPPERGISAGSEVATLMFRTSLKDGSADNVLDRASCISLKLPIVVTIEGDSYVVNNLEEDIEVISERLDELEGYPNDDDDDDNDEDDDDDDDDDQMENVALMINFPVTIILPDYTEVPIGSSEELNVYQNLCAQEDGVDDDIECIDFTYPLYFSVFDTEKQIFDKRTIIDDAALNSFISELTGEDIVSAEFPVLLKLSDSSMILVENLEELDATLEVYKDDCDEDDNNSFSKPDCEGCSSSEFTTVWATCTVWEAHKFKVDGDNIKGIYVNYSFEFLSNGTVIIDNGTVLSNGTWLGSGSGNNISLQLDFPGLEDFNKVWMLQEFKDKGDNIDVRLYNGEDELHIQSTCDKD